MRYTQITMSGRHRVLFNGPKESRFVTTTASVDDAKQIAAALEGALDDLPNKIDYSLAVLLGVAEDLDLDEGAHAIAPDGFHIGWDPYEWSRSTLPVDTIAPVGFVRRMLSWLDKPAGPAPMWGFDALAEVLSRQPESVTRAVREEVATQLAPYDSVPVCGVVYDRKWDEVRTPVCLNAGLEMLTSEQLDALADGPNADNVALDLLSLLENAGLADFGYSAKTADQGYLEVAVHRQLLAAWRAATGR